MVTFSGGVKIPQGGFRLKASLPPTWTSTTNLGSNHESKTITESPYSLVASDPEDDPLTYSFVSGTLPIGATINSDGTITGPAVTVTANQQFDFVASVSDGVSPINKAFFITVNENANPTWDGGTGADLGSVDESSSINIQLTAVDSDGLPMALTYSEFGGSFPAWLDISSSGLLTGTAPAVDDDEIFMFTVEASDGDESASRQFTLTIAQVFAVAQTFTADGTFVIPGGVTTLRIKTWGGGGGGGLLTDIIGGPGGFAQADIDVSSFSSVLVRIGGGGLAVPNRTGGANGGGNGGLGGNRSGSGAGGYSGVFHTSVTQGNSLIIAGGGGATGQIVVGRNGGAGGGLTGQAGISGSNGGGGTQVAGGAAGNLSGDTPATAGTALQGGRGGSSAGNWSGGGGGGGYFGGGGAAPGTSGGGAGGGGSGFVGGAANSSFVQNLGGDGVAPNTSDDDYVAGKAAGGNGSGNGQAGLVVILI